MTAPSALITGSQRQPEVKGEWMSEQHSRRENEGRRVGKKAVFIPFRLHQMTDDLQFSALSRNPFGENSQVQIVSWHIADD